MLKTLGDFKMAEYKPGKLKFQQLSKDVVLVTYPLAQKGTYKGKTLPAKSHASSVWVKRDGRWLEATYQETAVEGD
jgi:hypothetical protein